MTENYPLGSDTKEAPWNQEILKEKEIEVTVSITLSKTVKIKVSDYKVVDKGIDEDGNYFEDIDINCDLKDSVINQKILPNKAYTLLDKNESPSNYEDLKDWNVDDFEVVLE